MNIEEIRKNAPDGATHYILYKNGSIQYLKCNDFIQHYQDGFWYETKVHQITFDLFMTGIYPI